MTQPAAQTWTIGAVLKWATDDFRSRGIDTPRLDAELLLGHALGLPRIQLIIEATKPLAPSELARFRDLVKRRRAREPVAYVLGQREFYGRIFKVDRRVLVPRPDTETLVDVALTRTRHLSMSARTLDLCTGSGCVAISVARERPTAPVVAVDLSDDALAVARENAFRLGAYNVAFAKSDLFSFAGTFASSRPPPRFDAITANPPYIAADEIPTLAPEIHTFEPRLALDGGDDGLAIVRRIIDEAPRYLKEGGVLAIEIGAGQADAVRALFEARGYAGIESARDIARIERVVSGVSGVRGVSGEAARAMVR